MSLTIQYLDPALQNIIQRITENLLIDQIYLHPYLIHGKQVNQLYILLRNSAGQGIVAARALCNLAVAEKPEYRCLVALPEDVNRKIKQGNMRATLVCQPDKLVFEHPDADTRIQLPEVDYHVWYEQAKSHFHKEVSKIDAFAEGYSFYLNKTNYGLAAFMLHQVIEQGYRAAENLVMGKEKISHSLRNHQEYIAPFSPELGTLFAKQHELSILGKLDESYSSVRYDHDFSMSTEDLVIAANKGKELLAYLTAFNRDLLGEIEQHTALATADDEPMSVDGASEEATHANALMSNEATTAIGTESTNKTKESNETTVIKPCETGDDHRGRILAAIRTYFTPTHVFCFAHQSRQESSQNLVISHNKKSSYHRYYLAIVTDDQPDQALHKQHQVNEALGGELEVVALYFKFSTFNRKLEEGHGFFSFLVNDAEEWEVACGFSNQGVKSKAIDVEKQRWIWKRHFWSAEGLLEMVQDHIGSRYDECCSAIMSQAMEQLCISLLYAFWGYRPDNALNLMYLINLTESITPLAPKCFCMDVPAEREMVVELSKALHEFRYNSNFGADGYSLHILHDRLLTFSREVEELVDRHFETLTSANK